MTNMSDEYLSNKEVRHPNSNSNTSPITKNEKLLNEKSDKHMMWLKRLTIAREMPFFILSISTSV